MIVFDSSMKLIVGRRVTGSSRGFIIGASNRNLHIKCENGNQFIDLLYALSLAK